MENLFDFENSTKIDLGNNFKIKVCTFVSFLEHKFIVVAGYQGKRAEYEITVLKVIEIIKSKDNSLKLGNVIHTAKLGDCSSRANHATSRCFK